MKKALFTICFVVLATALAVADSLPFRFSQNKRSGEISISCLRNDVRVEALILTDPFDAKSATKTDETILSSNGGYMYPWRTRYLTTTGILKISVTYWDEKDLKPITVIVYGK